MENKVQVDISDELVDEIVEEVLSEIPEEIQKTKSKKETIDDISNSAGLKLRLQHLENRVGKHVHDYQTTAVEVERQIVEKFSEFEEENEKRLLYLQGQLQELRDAMIRLSNEFRQIKESISSQKR